MSLLSAIQWDTFLSQHPEAHLLQTPAWGALKAAHGWEPYYVQAQAAGAQVLFRKLPLGFHIAYIPKGPVGQEWNSLWPEVDRLCRQKRAVFLKVEPDQFEPAPQWMSAGLRGFLPGQKPIQPRRSVVIDLSGPPEAWLERMKQKTRYNIRLAERKGIQIQPSADIETYQRLAAVTGQRDGFGVHNLAYHRRAYELFACRGESVLLVASYEERPLAAVMVFRHGSRAWYLYGASNDMERNRMPTYLLQWEAMRWAAQQGCTSYDLWGIPDAEEDQLEQSFSGRSDGLWGVYRFKRGFGGTVVRSVGAWDRVYQPALYRLYHLWESKRSSRED
jgi:peptidoglycan pentaglycine glycine transferase (the first glycine)